MHRIGLAVVFSIVTVLAISLQERPALAYGGTWIVGSGLFNPPNPTSGIFVSAGYWPAGDSITQLYFQYCDNADDCSYGTSTTGDQRRDHLRDRTCG